MPKAIHLPRWGQIVFALILFGASASRYALTSGQVTFLVLCLILITIQKADTQPWLAGISLGLALSKYSLSAGVFLYYLVLDPKVRLLASALCVQAAGIFVLMFTTGTSFAQVLQGYSLMFEHHVPMDGIHLASLFPGRNNLVDILFAAGFTIIVLGILMRFRDRSRHPEVRYILISALLAWSLLVAYHRAYDASVLILILYLITSVIHAQHSVRMPKKLRILVLSSIYTALFIVMLPAGEIARQFFPSSFSADWTTIFSRLTTFIILGSLFLAIVTVYKTKPTNEGAPNE